MLNLKRETGLTEIMLLRISVSIYLPIAPTSAAQILNCIDKNKNTFHS